MPRWEKYAQVLWSYAISGNKSSANHQPSRAMLLLRLYTLRHEVVFFFFPRPFFFSLSGQASFSSRKISQHLLLKQTQTPQMTVYPASTSIPRPACVVSHRLGSELGKFFQLEAAEQKLDKQSESQHCARLTWYHQKDLTSKTSSDFTICKL